MKRSRACDDLVALAELTSASDWRCVKRSRACCGDDADMASDADSERHSLQFSLEMSDMGEVGVETAAPALSSSAPAPARWTWGGDAKDDAEDDSLPLRRNSREQILRRRQQHKEQHRIARLAGGAGMHAAAEDDVEVGNPALQPKLMVAPPRALSFLESPETRASGFPLESRCIDPLDKRQAQPFDMSAFLMLSISPKP